MIFMHLLAIFACLANSLAMTLQYALVIAIGIHLRFTIKHLKNGLCTIKYSEASGWQIAKDRHFESVQILPSTTITRFAVFLHFNNPKSKSALLQNNQAALVFYDALAEDDFRRFAVSLKTSFINSRKT